MKRSPLWAPKKRIQEAYRSDLHKLMREVGKYLTSLDDPADILLFLRTVVHTPFYQEYAEAAAMKMVTQLFSDAGRTWRQAAKVNSRGREVYATMQREMKTMTGFLVGEQVQRNAAYIKSAPGDIASKMTNFVLEESMKGTRASDIADMMKKKWPHLSETRVNTIARTETSKTSTALTQARSDLAGVKFYVWRTSEDSRVRESHTIMDGVIVPWDAPPSPEELAGEKGVGHYHAGNVFNCFPGSEYVNLANGCYKLWRRRYEGTTIALTVLDSAKLQATPNHPVLTARGWLPINQVKKGDYLIQALHNRGEILEDNQSKPVTSFVDLFNALAGLCPVETRLGSKLDFHGDGTEYDVDVINVDRLLADYLMAEFFEGLAEFNLTGSDVYLSTLFSGQGLFAKSMRRVFAAHGVVGLANKFFAFLDRKMGHSDRVCLASSSTRDIAMSENLTDCPTTARVSDGERKFAFASQVPRDYLIAWESILPLILKIIGEDNTPSSESIAERVRLAAGDFSSGFKAGAFSYQLREVVDVTISEFIGHVYNLQSNGSWYSVTHNNLVVHNCRCYPEPLVDLDYIDWPAKVYTGGKAFSV
ncbi:hypothetical protein LJK87_17440 [Paenibacillus sp. P25]|nr:hypothetical protein LJK87_17440 [Paenibacillus sp. P25]